MLNIQSIALLGFAAYIAINEKKGAKKTGTGDYCNKLIEEELKKEIIVYKKES